MKIVELARKLVAEISVLDKLTLVRHPKIGSEASSLFDGSEIDEKAVDRLYKAIENSLDAEERSELLGKLSARTQQTILRIVIRKGMS